MAFNVKKRGKLTYYLTLRSQTNRLQILQSVKGGP
jgi:hypothetical protein